MPYKSEKMQIPRKYDKRVKLSLEDRQKIKELYGKVSQRKLAALFGVSRSMVRWVGDPEKHKKNLQRRKERAGWVHYYDKEKHANYVKKHRRGKQELFLKGKLGGKK
jgi:hypothetical protein